MTKVIHKQTNKIVLALLALGGMVHPCMDCASASSKCHRGSALISEQSAPVVPGNIGHNGDSAHYLSLPGSSGDTTTAQPTQVETDATLTVRRAVNGAELLKSDHKLEYSEVIGKIRPQLGPGRIIKLTQNGQVIPQNTPGELGGEIGYTVESRIEIVLTVSNGLSGIQLLKSDHKLEYSEVIGKIRAFLKAKGIINYYRWYRVRGSKPILNPS